MLNKLNSKIHNRIVYWSLGITVLILVTIFIIAPWYIRGEIESAFVKLGVEKAHVNDVSFNPFTGRFIAGNVIFYKNQQPQFKLKHLSITISWTSLFNRKILIDRILATEMDVNVQYKDNKWIIAGLTIDQNMSLKSKQVKQPYALIVKNARLQRIRFHIHYKEQKKTFLIKEVALSNINSTLLHEKKGLFNLHGTVDDGVYDIGAKLDLFSDIPSIELNIKLTNFPVSIFRSFSPVKLAKVKSNADYEGTITARFLSSGLVEMTHKGDTILKESHIAGKDYSFSDPIIKFSDNTSITYNYPDNLFNLTAKVSAHWSKSTITLITNGHKLKAKALTINGQVTLSNKTGKLIVDGFGSSKADQLSLIDKDSKFNLFHINKLHLSGIRYKRNMVIDVNKLETGNLIFANSINQKRSLIDEFSQRLIKINSTKITNMKVHASKSFSIDSINLKDSAVHLYRQSERWAILARVRKAINELKFNLPKFNINSIKLSGSKKIHIYDNSFKPQFVAVINLTQAELHKLNSRIPSNASTFILNGKTEGYTKFELTGSITPFADKLSMSVNGNIKEMELPKYTPYTGKYYGYELISGQLDAQVLLHISRGILSGVNKIVLRRFKIKQTQNDKSRFKLKLPVATLAQLMANTKNEIKFDIPNTGNLYDPNFKLKLSYLNSFEVGLKRGLAIAFQYTQPVGQAYFLLRTTNKLLTSMRIKAIEFLPGSDHLSEKALKQITRVAKLLTKKKSVTLRLCGTYTQQDIDKLKIQYPDDSLKKFKELAEALSLSRSRKVKGNLVTQHSINSNRLVICESKFNSGKKAKSSVKFAP